MKFMMRSILICVGLLFFWQAIVTIWQLPDYILPAPYQVLLVLKQQSHIIAAESVSTIIEMLIGFVLGILFGCSAALLITYFRPLSLWFLPILIISQAIPTFAIAPLLVIWFGYGMASKIATTVLMIFFPVTSSFYDGLKQINPALLDLAHTMNAKKWRVFWHLRMPAALPALASGIRIAAVVAPIGALVGEWVGASHGLGYLMLNANARTQIDMMFAALLIIIALSLLLYFSVNKLLKMAVWW